MNRYRAAARRGGRSSGRARQRLNDTPTPAEAALARALDDAGIQYQQNYQVNTASSFSGYYLVDFRIADHKLFIEVDGKPHVGEAAQWRDRLRTEAILEARPSYRLVRVWNSDLLRDPAAWVNGHVRSVGP